ncbi:7011_t:CDS:2, partial [Acaulospora colombiana]
PETKTRMLVVQHVNGNLRTFLNNSKSLKWHEKIKMAVDLADAIELMHRCNIIHYELHTASIFVDGKKLLFTDPRLCSLFNTTSSLETINSMIPFVDPCILLDPYRTVDKSSNVYSYG